MVRVLVAVLAWSAPVTRSAASVDPVPIDAAPVDAPAPIDAPSEKPSPPSTSHRILSVLIQDNKTALTVLGGEDRGVHRTWRAQLLDQHGNPLDKDLEIVRVEQRQTVLRGPLQYAARIRDKTSRFVRLAPR